MEAETQFELHGALCEIVAEESLSLGPEGSPAILDSGTVIGRCRLNGHRYLIVCADVPKQGEGLGSIDAACQLTRRELDTVSGGDLAGRFLTCGVKLLSFG